MFCRLMFHKYCAKEKRTTDNLKDEFFSLKIFNFINSLNRLSTSTNGLKSLMSYDSRIFLSSYTFSILHSSEFPMDFLFVLSNLRSPTRKFCATLHLPNNDDHPIQTLQALI